jgi:integrase
MTATHTTTSITTVIPDAPTSNIIQFPSSSTPTFQAPTNFFSNTAPLLDPDEYSDFDSTESHAASPLWDINDINHVCAYLLETEQYRNLMLFVCGINFGLRISDLLKLKFTDIMGFDTETQSWQFRDVKYLIESKTAHTRKTTTNRVIYINNAVRASVSLFLAHNPNFIPTDYMFSRKRSYDTVTYPLTRSQADRIIKKIATECELPGHIATHTLRKTYAVHLAMTAKENKETMLSDHGMALAQHSLGHSSMKTTLRYLDINDARVQADVMRMNLGYDVLAEYLQTHN